MYVETLQEIVFMKKRGESVADIISTVVKTYLSRTEESEGYVSRVQVLLK